jgi:hypothetical protein
MARTVVFGPIGWDQPRGQNGMLPGNEHRWWVGDFSPPGGLTFQVSAHPSRNSYVQELAITSLSTVYGGTGGPGVNFTIRNVGPTGVSHYRIFVSYIDF